jgi:hypothetical protein
MQRRHAAFGGMRRFGRVPTTVSEAEVARALHNTSLSPIALWQLQGDDASPEVLAVTDTAGDAGGPYNLTKNGTTQLGMGHAPQFQGWVNVTERLTSTDTDLNLTGAMTFAIIATPHNTATGIIAGWGGNDDTEANNYTWRMAFVSNSLQYFHEQGAGGDVVFGGTNSGIVVGQPQHVAFTRDSAGTGLKMFINGTLVESTTLANAPTGGGSGNFFMGEDQDGTSPFVGSLVSGILFDSELSEAQVLSMARLTMGF